MEGGEKIFDVEKVTKRFYDRFQKEHAIFMDSIQGLEQLAEQNTEQHTWYTSVILNRLMFLYFLQQQGFLATTSTSIRDGDTNYLRNRLRMVQKQNNKNTQNTYYHSFLLPLFHTVLSKRERISEMEPLFGNVPYLHNELFHMHELESGNGAIKIPDAAFERIFNFLDEFQWILEQRPLRNEREINSDVLGYVFEKHINQQQMGAYYTREDVTTYIASNSILPALFEAVERAYPRLFGKEGTVWQLLQQNPERYIRETLRSKTYLPTETEREYRERQAYYLQLRERIQQGAICCIDDFISYNLALDLFIRDILHNIDEPEVLYTFYQCLTQMTILDPTCGSGAFLHAALRILIPLYETCLQQIQIVQPSSITPPVLAAFMPPTVGARFIAPTSILRSIISTNLYGVDIMEEATELCKLRLFLLLVGALKGNENIEALAEVNFHIRADNALVGFSQPMPPLRRGASLPPPGLGNQDFARCRAEANSRPYGDTQQSDMVRRTLDWELAREYNINGEDTENFEQWKESHKPFHWQYAFAEVIESGRFRLYYWKSTIR